MLIISRKHKESFLIEGKDGPIEIVVTEISPGQVRLGIDAPSSYKIWRKELRQTIEYNKQATTGPTSASALKSLAEKLK